MAKCVRLPRLRGFLRGMEPGHRGIDEAKHLQTSRFPNHAGFERDARKASGRSDQSWQQKMPICRMFSAGTSVPNPNFRVTIAGTAFGVRVRSIRRS